MESLQINSVGATFVNMVMDRLQDLETKHMHEVGALKQQNHELTLRVNQLSGCLYLREDFKTFSDGTALYPAFGHGTDCLCACRMAGDVGDVEIDDLHLNAAAFYGKVVFDIELSVDSEDEDGSPPDTEKKYLVMGEPGVSTTVRDMLLAFNMYCLEQQKLGNDTCLDLLDCYEGFQPCKYDEKLKAPVYELHFCY